MRSLHTYRKFALLIAAICCCLFVLKAGSNENLLFDSAAVYVYDNPEKAIEIAEQLITQNSERPEIQIRALMILTNAFATKRDYQHSLEAALRAKELVASLKNPVLEFGILIKLAAQYHSLGVNGKALQVLDESDKLFESVKNKDSLLFDMGSNYAIKGFIYSGQLGCDIAIDYFDKAIGFYTSSLEKQQKISLNTSVVLYNKGNCQISLNRLDSALAHFNESRRLVSHIDANTLQAFPMKGIAEVYTLEGKHEAAIEVLFDANTIAGGAGDLELNAGIYKGLADNYLALHQWEDYLYYDRLHSETLQELKISERNTINNILQLYKDEISTKEKIAGWKFMVIILGVGIIFLWLIYAIISSEISFTKKLSTLKSQIEL